MRLERPRLGFDHSLQVYRSKNGVPRELHDGDIVMTGDRIRASVLTSESAHLYLAFCSHQKLAIYPPQGGIRLKAGELLLVPEGGGALVLDGDPGPEVLYLILSRTEIAVADPHLAEAIAATRPGDRPVDCGPSLDSKLVKPLTHVGSAKALTPAPTSSAKVLRGTEVRKRSISSAAHNGHVPPSSEGANAPSPGSLSTPSADPPPDPDFERNPGSIVWYSVDGVAGLGTVVAADADGIAVVRYELTHVAPASPP